MNSPRQLDAFRDNAKAQAQAYRIAAERAEVDFHYPSEAERKARADYYRREAERIEAAAGATT